MSCVAWECPKVQGWPCWSSLSTGPELWPALACWREITTLLPWAVCFRTGFHCHFCCDQCWQVLCFLDCYYCHCWCWTVHCHLLRLSWCVWGSTLLLPSLSWSLSEIPMQATAEQRCGSKNWSVIQIVELFRNISFSWGQQKTWCGIGRWICHCTDPVFLFLFDLGQGAGPLVPSLSTLTVIWS